MVPTDDPLISVQNLNLQNYILTASDSKHTLHTALAKTCTVELIQPPGEPELG